MYSTIIYIFDTQPNPYTALCFNKALSCNFTPHLALTSVHLLYWMSKCSRETKLLCAGVVHYGIMTYLLCFF